MDAGRKLRMGGNKEKQGRRKLHRKRKRDREVLPEASSPGFQSVLSSLCMYIHYYTYEWVRISTYERVQAYK